MGDPVAAGCTAKLVRRLRTVYAGWRAGQLIPDVDSTTRGDTCWTDWLQGCLAAGFWWRLTLAAHAAGMRVRYVPIRCSAPAPGTPPAAGCLV